MTFVKFVEDRRGDVLGFLTFCCRACFLDYPDDVGAGEGGEWPCLEPADYDRYCAGCGTLVSRGIQ